MAEISPEVCLLLANERSGTHFLRSLLNKVPTIAAAHGEIANAAWDGNRTSPLSFFRFREQASIADRRFFYPTPLVQRELLDNYFSHVVLLHPGNQSIVLDVKYSHVHNFNAFWWDVNSRPLLLQYAFERNFRIIHLIRKKPYQTVVSDFYAMASGVWQTKSKDELPSLRVNIDRRKLQERTIQLVKSIAAFRRWLQGCRVATIEYEGLTGNTNRTLAQLQKFLGLDNPIPPHSDQLRTTPPYEEAIENFPEIADLIEKDLYILLTQMC